MNEIMKKTFELIDVLEESELISELGRCREKIVVNQDLSELIKRGNSTDDEYALLDIKRRLYNNNDYKNYMDKYNELMYIVMDINYRYSKLLGTGKGCCRK